MTLLHRGCTRPRLLSCALPLAAIAAMWFGLHSARSAAEPVDAQPPVSIGDQPAGPETDVRVGPFAVKGGAFDFGVVTPGHDLSGRFVLRNATDQAIPIVRITTSCSCAVADPERRVIEAGESVSLDVRLKGPAAPSEFVGQWVRIEVAGPADPVEIPIRAVGRSYLFAEVSHAQRDPGGVVRFTLELKAGDGAPFRILAIRPETLAISDEAPSASHALTVAVQPNQAGRYPSKLALATDHPLQREISVDLRAAIDQLLGDEGSVSSELREVAPAQRSISFRPIDGESGRLRAIVVVPDWPLDKAPTLRWGDRSVAFSVASLRSSPTGVEIELEASAQSDSARQFRCQLDLEGEFTRTRVTATGKFAKGTKAK